MLDTFNSSTLIHTKEAPNTCWELGVEYTAAEEV